jgi:hypothetical protein
MNTAPQYGCPTLETASQNVVQEIYTQYELSIYGEVDWRNSLGESY